MTDRASDGDKHRGEASSMSAAPRVSSASAASKMAAEAAR